LSLGLYPDAACVVCDESTQAELDGQPVNEWAKAHSLHLSCRPKAATQYASAVSHEYVPANLYMY
jgi:hypothetical protein